MAGRVVLIKSTLDSLPSYWFNLFNIPVEICKRLELIRRRFLWGEVTDNGSVARKLHLICWNQLLKDKKLGDLSLTSILQKNRAMLGKWWFNGFLIEMLAGIR